MSVDLYRILEVDPSAAPEVIQAAYRTRARRVHPDVTGHDEDMKLLNQAWDVLKDPGRRASYDRGRGGHGDHPEDAMRREAPSPPRDQGPVEGSNEGGPNWAGDPPGNPHGMVIAFGRYRGWSLAEIARVDPDYLEWVTRVPAGRRYREEAEAMLANVRSGKDPVPRRHRDLFAAIDAKRGRP